MNKPLVSIGLPTYNRAQDLRACLANLTSLDYKNIEIIISDNHSTDTTADVCKEYVKNDKRIRYYRQKVNGGVTKNSQFVLKRARGKYFFWASDDDLHDRKYLSEIIPLLENNPKATLAITGATLFTKTQSLAIHLYFKTYSHSPVTLLTYLFHPECVSVLIYGVHRLNKEFIYGTKKITREKRPAGINGDDNSSAIYLLLRGDLLYIPKNLFFIRDNGMYLSAFQNLSEVKLSKVFFQKVLRYLSFPIMFLCNWYYGSLHVLRSALPFYQKAILLFCVLLKLLLDIILFFYYIFKGVTLFLFGTVRKIIRFLPQIFFLNKNNPQP